MDLFDDQNITIAYVVLRVFSLLPVKACKWGNHFVSCEFFAASRVKKIILKFSISSIKEANAC